MKKSMKETIAARLVESIKKGAVTVDREGTVTQKGKIVKRKLSAYIIKKMIRMGATLAPSGYYEV